MEEVDKFCYHYYHNDNTSHSDQEGIMIHTEPAVKVRQNLGELLNKVQYRHDSILITKADKPVAAIVDVELFEKIRRMREEFETLMAKFAQTSQAINTETLENDINEVIRTIRRKNKKRKG